MIRDIKLKINGKDYSASVQDRMLLVQFIRDVAGLGGTHIGCDTGHCGACTVLLGGRSVKSCMVLVVRAVGQDIVTIEGMQDGLTTRLKEAFRENFAIQCGYCTPGFLVETHFLLKNNPHPTEEEIKDGISGNICRCNGYPNIVRAVKTAAEAGGS